MAALLAASGCFSSSHVGRDPRKVYMTIQDGSRGYTKNGEFYREVGFGGGLVEAVEDHPEALRAAQTFRGRALGGFLMAIAGSLCIPATMIWGLVRANEDGGDFPAGQGYLLLGCAVLAIAGTTYMVSGMPYQFDAVNIYNDAVDAQRVPWPPPHAPQLPPMQLGPPGT